jgi:hypothetical protein
MVGNPTHNGPDRAALIAAFQHGLLVPLTPCDSTSAVEPMTVLALSGLQAGAEVVVLCGQDGTLYDAMVRPIWGNTGTYYWLTAR